MVKLGLIIGSINNWFMVSHVIQQWHHSRSWFCPDCSIMAMLLWSLCEINKVCNIFSFFIISSSQLAEKKPLVSVMLHLAYVEWHMWISLGWSVSHYRRIDLFGKFSFEDGYLGSFPFQFLWGLGLPEDEVECFDVFGLDGELLEMVPKPVLAVLFLYPITSQVPRFRCASILLSMSVVPCGYSETRYFVLTHMTLSLF